jgi:hypothetical protein
LNERKNSTKQNSIAKFSKLGLACKKYILKLHITGILKKGEQSRVVAAHNVRGTGFKPASRYLKE